MGDIKLKKGTGILFIMAVLFISSLLYLRYWDQDVLRVGIFYGSNWEVPGTVHYEILDKAIKKFKSKYPNIKVEYEKGILSDDYSEWLSEQILKGEEPDVYLVLDEDFHTLASLGALKNLDGVINVDKEFKKEEFYSSAQKAITRQVPHILSTRHNNPLCFLLIVTSAVLYLTVVMQSIITPFLYLSHSAKKIARYLNTVF